MYIPELMVDTEDLSLRRLLAYQERLQNDLKAQYKQAAEHQLLAELYRWNAKKSSEQLDEIAAELRIRFTTGE